MTIKNLRRAFRIARMRDNIVAMNTIVKKLEKLIAKLEGIKL